MLRSLYDVTTMMLRIFRALSSKLHCRHTFLRRISYSSPTDFTVTANHSFRKRAFCLWIIDVLSVLDYRRCNQRRSNRAIMPPHHHSSAPNRVKRDSIFEIVVLSYLRRSESINTIKIISFRFKNDERYQRLKRRPLIR